MINKAVILCSKRCASRGEVRRGGQEDTGLGGKGGERGGAMRRTKNGFGTTPYFLVIADDQEG